MCGIAGIALKEGAVTPERLEGFCRRLGHRGPDDAGFHLDGPVGIAHTRLSVIDLAGGHQPLIADGGRLVLAANGEIYNHVELRAELEAQGHRFTTRSDCETILHAYQAYGDDFIGRLHGMFAFALWDADRRRLLLVRDRLGIKPLFLARLPEGLAFASELKALYPLLPGPPEVEPAGLVQYMQHQFSSGRTTLVRGTERVLPGEALALEADGSERRWRYWSATAVEPHGCGEGEAMERFDALMAQVMREHMRADVPFGLFLSGGVDSSILLALLTRYGERPVRTFSVGFPESRITDELPLARRIAERFGSRHTVLQPEPLAMLHRLPGTVWAADELMRDNANLPTALLAEAAAKELKVVFSGEGGDEAFAGYGRYRLPRAERWLNDLLAPGSGGFRTRGMMRGRWRGRLFGEALLEALPLARAPFVDAWSEAPGDWSAIARMQYVDLVTALPDNLLVKSDRMLMARGVEGRVPFLDHRVVEFGLALPDALKVRDGQGKWFLKRWASRFLREEDLFARKRGFNVPVGEWLQGELLDRLEQRLAAHPGIRAWFRPAGVARLCARQRSRGDAARPLMALLQFAIWHTLFVQGGGERPDTERDPLEIIA